jgi:putative ABC transport system permease protein
MLSLVRIFGATFVIAARRLWASRWLALAAIVGLVAVVGLALSVPLYADAVYHRTLQTTLADAQIDQQGIRRPPFTFMFRYAGKYDGALDWQGIAPIDRYMVDTVPAALGLPRTLLVRSFETRLGQLFPITETAYLDQREPLLWTSVATLGDLAQHVDVVDGALPTQEASSDTIGVMVSKAMADKLGIQLGERYVLFYKPDNANPVQLPVQVTGLWQARNAEEAFWFSHPEALNETLVTTEQVYTGQLAPRLSGEVFQAVWYMVFDGTGVRSENVAPLLERIKLTMTRISAILSRVKLEVSPIEALETYQATSRVLTAQLLAINTPILLLMFAYTLLVASLLVGGRRNEIAVLRSRGATVLQVLGIALLEACVLGALAMLAGAPVAQGLAALVGQTRSFLNFTGATAGDAPLRVVITQSSLLIALGVGALAAVLMLFPTWTAAHNTVITYKQDRARSMRPPWWQRAWIDVLLLIPVAYGTYLLRKQGAIVLPVALSQGAATVQDPFDNPLLFMVPVLAILAITLFLIRLFPYVVRLVAWLLARFPGAALVMSARQLARSPSFYAAPMLLLVLTLGLATFTASLAATLDQHLMTEMRYTTGGDMSLNEQGESTRDTGVNNPLLMSSNTQSDTDANAQSGPLYMFMPVEDHLKVNGVLAATRIGAYRADAHFSTHNATATYMGVDRLDFTQVSYWRSDFATLPLGTLMNALAAHYDGVLVPESILAENALGVGDTIQVNAHLQDGDVVLPMTIVGTFRLWPGWDPNDADEGPLFVGNLDYFFQEAGGQVPYSVWLKTRGGSDPRAIAEGVSNLGVLVKGYRDVQTLVDQEQMRPARQGLFGMLSVGFGAAGLFTVLGFFLYTVFSLRRRTIELGVLRAMGFSSTQMGIFLGGELALLLGVGVAAGTFLGVLASRTYIPYFQMNATVAGRALPFAVVVAWPEVFRIYAIFGVLFVVALAALLLLLRGMRVFEAVKLGESE